MSKHIARKPAAWQTEAVRVTTDMVQYWLRGTMVKIVKSESVAMIGAGEAFVISAQAIGALVNGKMES
jgi:hypothetical protein